MEAPYTRTQIEQVTDYACHEWLDIEKALRNAMGMARNLDFDAAVALVADAKHSLTGMQTFLMSARDMQQSNERVALAAKVKNESVTMRRL